MKHPYADLARMNLRLARMKYGSRLSYPLRSALQALTRQFGFSLQLGEVLLLEGSWYVNHSGLLRLATRKGCVGIRVQPVAGFCTPAESRWAFRATAFKSSTCKGFNGYGDDADPGNVSAMVRGAEMRIAETRAVNRALRKAYGIGLCSIEEIGTLNPTSEPQAAVVRKAPHAVNGNGRPMRDRLYLLVRQHQLDAGLVKLYAADYCGTQELRQVSRDKLGEFIDHLSQEATSNREALQQKLAGYQRTEGAA
jgi:hypothetical protein